MHPVKGTVVDTSGGCLGIRLETRAIVHVANNESLRLGDICYILYDYTTMHVRSVMSAEEYKAEDIEPQLKLEESIEEPDWVAPHELAAQSEGDPGVSL